MASMVTTGGILADIGTDHAYVPIALVQRQKIKGAIAMDINEGPLARAQEHIRAARLEEYIQTRLSAKPASTASTAICTVASITMVSQ